MKSYPKQMSELLFTRARLGKPTSEADAKFNQELAEACSSGVSLKAWLYENPDYHFINGSVKSKLHQTSNDGSLLAF
jgi:hypothetical protein